MSKSSFARQQPEKWDRVGIEEVMKVASNAIENDDPPRVSKSCDLYSNSQEEETTLLSEEYSPEIKKEAIRILNEEDPIKYLLNVFHSDHVGDKFIALSCYMSATSRFVTGSKDIHFLTIGPSRKGKSLSYGTLFKQMPKTNQIDGSISYKRVFYYPCICDPTGSGKQHKHYDESPDISTEKNNTPTMWIFRSSPMSGSSG